ncbi:MAG TPA: geranylgeranyl reductase family protein [Candidatus Thermoplasmatota archaeon]|nr:geranylgeranyl reductase family protein [Candidatus Thermoplasmatota archaeon]
MEQYDVIVVGGGPGGSTTATFLAREGHRVLLLEKATFPRDKVCGDAISGKSASVLREMGIADVVEEAPHAIAEGVLFSGPKGDLVQIPFPKDIDPTGIKNSKKYNYVTAGYVSRRLVYDDILFQHAKAQKSVTTIEDVEVSGLLREGPRVTGVRMKDGREFRAPLVIGADGAMSVVAKEVGAFERDHDHWIGAFRVYYQGVTGMSNDIEIHFVDGLIPGYFWIFPLDNGLANVGSGMIETDLQDKTKSIRLIEDTYRIMREHPMFKERFANAKEVDGSRRGWLLPLGSKHRPIAGDGWMLVGDAAALIDPFSGEGIGNAMVSGRLAAAQATKALAARDFSKAMLFAYESAVRSELDRELQMSYKLQKLGRRTWLLNFVLRRAARSERVRNTISAMLADREKKENFGSFFFYLRLLFM